MFPRTARSLSRIPRPALWAIAASFTAPFVASQATQVWEVSEVNNRLGAAIDAGHDVNGDGVPDVIVGVPGGDENGVPTGRARVLSGTNGSVIHDVAFWSITFSSASRGGEAVALLGDLNADGRSEFAVGGPRYDNSGSFGVFSGIDGSLLLRVDATVSGQLLGTRIENLGDLDGDGKNEFSVTGRDPAAIATTISNIYSGATLGIVQTIAGTAFAGGDIDGDGRPDLLSIVSGVGVEARDGQSFSLLNTISVALVGPSVASLGDVDGDGRSDTAVISRNAFTGAVNVFVHRGSDGSQLSASPTITSGSASNPDIVSIGDVNGDCVSDYALSVGSSLGGLTEFRSGVDHAFFFSHLVIGSGISLNSVATLGDLNADGFPEVLVGHAPFLTNSPTEACVARLLDLGFTGTIPSLKPIGAACPGSAGTLALSSASGCPGLGDTMSLIVRNALPNAPLVQNLGMSTNQPLDTAGMPGCVLLASGDGFNLFASADANGTATSPSFVVPNDVALLGAQLTSQAICVDAGANAAGFTTSRGLLITIGN